MIDFHRVTLEDKNWIENKIKKSESKSCEYCFGSIFGYDAIMKIYVAEYEGCLVTKCVLSDDFISYCCPVGDGNVEKALDAVIEEAENSNAKCDIFGMNEKTAIAFNKKYAARYEAVPDRDSFDYVYLASDLSSLTGKKYQPKRNHISYFNRTFDWTYETITEDNISDCLEMSKRWLEESTSDSKDDLEDELKIITRVFENYNALGFTGGLIRIGTEVVAYTMGEPLSDVMFCVHFEKAFPDIRGAYPMINQQFVKNELGRYTY
ncbi:MAG: DUF2156 domain-containing protein, partial [Acutalibacteraceae bacterium]